MSDRHPEITFGQHGHGARHLRGTGLSAEEVESAIISDLRNTAARGAAIAQSFRGRVTLQAYVIEYRAYHRGDGMIHVGTYYPILRLDR